MEESSPIVETQLNSNVLQAEWVLYFLLILFAVAIFMVLWKTVFFLVNRMRARALRVQVAKLVAGCPFEEFTEALEEQPGVEAWVLRHGLRYAANGHSAVSQQLEVASTTAKHRLEMGLTFLGTVGSNAPFVGLFGTVLGIIKAFRDLSLETRAGASAVMAGISEALVATAIGLLVAIPAVVAYNYLQRQVRQTLANSETLNQQVLFRMRATEGDSQ